MYTGSLMQHLGILVLLLLSPFMPQCLYPLVIPNALGEMDLLDLNLDLLDLVEVTALDADVKIIQALQYWLQLQKTSQMYYKHTSWDTGEKTTW